MQCTANIAQYTTDTEKNGVAYAAALRVFRVVLKSTVKVTRHSKHCVCRMHHCICSQKHRYSELNVIVKVSR